MTEEVFAGNLRMDAYVDTTGAARGLQRRMDTEMARNNIRAKIRAEIDVKRGMVGEARRAALAIEKQAAAAKVVVRIKAAIDARGLASQVKAAAAEASTAARIKIATELDKASAAKTAAAAAAVASDQTSTVEVDADTAPAKAEIAALRKGAEKNGVSIPVKIDRGAGVALMQLSKIPLLAGGFFALNGAIVAVGGGLVAMASSAASAAASLAVIPNLIGVAAQGIGGLLIGFSGVGDAVTALSEVQATATDTAKTQATATAAAAQQVEAARDQIRAATEAISDAEWNLARAHEAVQDAQESLTEARKAAREEIQELNEALRGSANDETAAMNAVLDAREALQDVKWDKSSTDKERRDAEQALKDAKQAYRETKDQNKDLRDEAREANKEGVAGSDQVKDAKDRLRDALHAEQEAQEALADAHRQAADAQEALTAAQQAAIDVTNEQSAAQQKLEDAYKNLSPAGIAFAKFLVGLKDRWYDLRNAVQTALLPPIQRGMAAALPLLDTLQTGLVDSARRVGNFVERLGTLFGSKSFNTDVAGIMRVNNRALGIFLDALYNLVGVFRDVAVVAGPKLLIPFAKWVRALTGGWREAAKVNRESGVMADYFERVRRRAGLLASILGNLWTTLVNIGRAAGPTGDSLLTTFDKVTKRWATWTGSEDGQKRLREFFATMKPLFLAIGDLVTELGQMSVALAEVGGGPLTGFVKGLTAMVQAITWLVEIPGVGKVIGWLLTLAGVGGAIGMVSGMFLKMGKNLQRVMKLVGLTKVWKAFRTSLLLTRIQLGLLYVQQKLVAAGSAIMSGALAALRGVMVAMRAAATLMFGPWGVAILAVVGLFILLYNKVDWFRKAVDWVVGKIVDAFHWIVDAAQNLWDKLFGHSVFPDIVDGIKWAWKIIAKVFKAFVAGFKAIGKAAKWMWEKAIKPAWNAMKAGISLYWNNVLKPIFKAYWTVLKTVGGWFKWMWEKAIKPAWNAIRDAISFVWNKVIKPVFSAFRDWIKKTLPDAFRAGVDAIKSIWDGLKAIASAPVEFIVNTVYNDGLRRMFNAIPGIPDLPEVEFSGFKRGGVMPGYTPNRDVHRFYSPTAGGLELSGGEAFMVPQWTRMIGTRGVEVMNEAARRGSGALAEVMSRFGMGVGRFFLGGVMPLQEGVATSEHPLPYYNTGAVWAGDLNSPLDLANPPAMVRAWKPGVVARLVSMTTSYGKHAILNHADGTSSLYAHMSSFLTNLGRSLGAGDPIGRVGETGNAFGVHLHFEQRGGTVSGTAGATAGATPAQQQEKSSWRSAVGTILDIVKKVPSWLSSLGKMGEWGSLLVKGLRSGGHSAIQWINDKIPNSFGPLPFPDNPIPNLFDRGGQWLSGTLGLNLSGASETVFTNENIVDITHDLAVIARMLQQTATAGDGRYGGGAPLVENLHLHSSDANERQAQLSDARRELRIIKMGGVHASRTR